MRRPPPTRSLLALVFAALSLTACNSDEAYCARYIECNEDEQDLDDDAMPVCKEQLAVQRDVLAANKGESCKKLQQLTDAWRACVSAISDCDKFNDELEPAEADECKDEREELDEYTEENASKCYAVTAPTPEGTDVTF